MLCGLGPGRLHMHSGGGGGRKSETAMTQSKNVLHCKFLSDYGVGGCLQSEADLSRLD